MDNKTYLANAHQENRNEWKSADAGSRTGDSSPKMLYVQHKLGSNYLSASGTGDEGMKRDILTGEIAKLIVRQPRMVAGILHKNRLRVPRTRAGLVDAVSDGLYNNKKFAGDIAMAIARNRGMDGTLSAEGDKADPGAILQGASSLVKGLGDLFGGKKKAAAQTAQAKAEAEKAKADAQKALAEAAKAHAAGAGLNAKIGYYILGGVLVASAIGTAIWYFKYKNK